MSAVVDKEKCTGCGECVETCAAEAVQLNGEKAVINEDECVECELCVDECPEGAIHMQ